MRGDETATSVRAESRLHLALWGTVVVGMVAGGQRLALAASDARPAKEAGGIAQASETDTSPGYPLDTRPPKDFFNDRLLRTLAREASATADIRHRASWKTSEIDLFSS